MAARSDAFLLPADDHAVGGHRLHDLGPNPFGFHLTNLALHAANGLLVYGLATRASRLLASLPGLTAALLAQCSIPPRTGSIGSSAEATPSTLFALSALLLAFQAARSGRGAARTCSLLAFALALATKETTVTVPFAAALGLASRAATDPTRDPPRDQRSDRLAAPLRAAAAGAYFVRKAITGHVAGTYGASGWMSSHSRPFQSAF
jgi:hypothetical protein